MERHYAECRVPFIVMLNVFMLSVVALPSPGKLNKKHLKTLAYWKKSGPSF
jgi:hypothetical protein